jgi:hypothetical protein
MPQWRMARPASRSTTTLAGSGRLATGSTGGIASPWLLPPSKETHYVDPMPKRATTKTDFILSLPHSLAGKEVVARAKAAGLKVSLAYVYSTRARRKGKANGNGKRGPGRPKANGAGASANVETLLIAVASELGLGHALEILQHERARVVALFR